MGASETQTVRAAPPSAAQCDRTGVRAFASRRALSASEMSGAPVRWPRPARLGEPLRLPAGKIVEGMRSLGVETVGELLEHLPTDSRAARTVAALRAGEQATVAVVVKAISMRPVRRRGMRPLVQATLTDATGSMRATFFNQPWLLERYPPGTRLLVQGKADAKGGFRVSYHAVGSESSLPALAPAAVEGGSVAHYPASEGVSSTQILTLVRGARVHLADVTEPLSADTRTSERLPDRACALAAMHFPRDCEDFQIGRRRLAFEELLLSQLVFLRRRARRAERTGAPVMAEA
ncbi:MAG: hypothetical protein M3Z95_08705, partial [Actinomycetota bacterium]|nr:hypothetical protein [Actinomycetota bacterium]